MDLLELLSRIRKVFAVDIISRSPPHTFSLQHILLIFLGCGLVVSMLAFYSNDPSSDPAEAYSFFCEMSVLNKRK